MPTPPAPASVRRPAPNNRGALRGRHALFLIVAILVASGATGLAVRYGNATRFPQSPLESWAMRIHGAAAMALLVVSGAIFEQHVLSRLRQWRTHAAGTATLLLFAVQVVSGYGLFYFSGDALRGATEWVHWIVGFGLPCVLARHVLARRAPHA
ncbi:hypothetical protein [Burkholderia ubonensis]|uniref:hypothetical protein n=1 Tax=Burkholderia ubonensis TaxID=101571 RepID=UPI0012F7C21B|nr:hypothetical protein [Burkholderia ubonensis]